MVGLGLGGGLLGGGVLGGGDGDDYWAGTSWELGLESGKIGVDDANG